MAVQLETHRFGILGLIILVIIAASALIAFVYLPTATITISPATSSRTKEQDIVLSAAAKEPDFVRFILPAKAISAETELSKDVVRTGAASHDDFAKGQVILHNEQDETQSLLPKSHLRHEATGVFFLTDSPVKIPPHGTVVVGVTAKEKGAAGNVPAGKFLVDKLPVSLQTQVYAISDLPFTGGVAVDTPLSQAEIDQAQKDLEAQAKQEALVKLSSSAGGAVVRPDLLSVQVISQDSTAPVGSLSQEFTARLKVKASAFLVDDNDLLGLTLLALRSQLGQDEEFVSYDPRSFTASLVAADFERGEARIKGKLTGLYAQKISPNAVQTSGLAGLTPNEVEEELKKFPGIGKVDVALSPFWVKTVPARAGAITINVQSSKQN